MATNDKLIQVRNLEKHYNHGKLHALDGISVDINKGDVMCVIGPSGSGKSTFLRSLNLMEEPTGGEVIFHNIDITKKSFINKQGKKEKVNIDLAFIGVSGCSVDAGFTCGTESDMLVKNLVIRKARTSVIMCDQSKLSRLMPYTFARLEDVDYVVSDGLFPSSFVQAAQAAGVTLL